MPIRSLVCRVKGADLVVLKVTTHVVPNGLAARFGPCLPGPCSSPARAALDAVGSAIEHELTGWPEFEADGCVLIETATPREAIDLANEFAPEHLQLVGAAEQALVGKVRAAGCVLLGRNGATAFGDYTAGSNHVLPTGGAARFASGLSPRHFRRRMSIVDIGDAAAAKLAQAGAPIAQVEGFPLHARSMRARAPEQPSQARVSENG